LRVLLTVEVSLYGMYGTNYTEVDGRKQRKMECVDELSKKKIRESLEASTGLLQL
jgi:hypothetical protein